MKNEKTSNTYNKKASPFTEIFRKLAGNETQQAIADKVGITRQNVGKWLSGETTPDINTLGKIADAYGVSTDYLLGRTPNKTTNTDIKSVCEYTGLSEKSVYIMHEEQKEGFGTNIATGINLLVRYNEIDILNLMQSYIKNNIEIYNGKNFVDFIEARDKSTEPNLCYSLGSEELRQIFKLEIIEGLDELSDKYNADNKKELEENGKYNAPKE